MTPFGKYEVEIAKYEERSANDEVRAVLVETGSVKSHLGLTFETYGVSCFRVGSFEVSNQAR